jgi:hypothetical protein
MAKLVLVLGIYVLRITIMIRHRKNDAYNKNIDIHMFTYIKLDLFHDPMCKYVEYSYINLK